MTDQHQDIPQTEYNFREWLNEEVLDIMKSLFEKQQITQDRIREMAEHTLSLIGQDIPPEELLANAVKLNEGFPEFDSLVIKLIKEYEQKYNKSAIDQVTKLVKNGSLDEAQSMVKKVLEFKMVS